MALFNRSVGLDPANFPSDAQVQQWLGPSGMRKSLPTNILDPPDMINVNLLRQAQRQRISKASCLANTSTRSLEVDNIF